MPCWQMPQNMTRPQAGMFPGMMAMMSNDVAHPTQSRPDSGLAFQITVLDIGGVPREQRMLKGHLPRVIYITEYSLVYEDYIF